MTIGSEVVANESNTLHSLLLPLRKTGIGCGRLLRNNGKDELRGIDVHHHLTKFYRLGILHQDFGDATGGLGQ